VVLAGTRDGGVHDGVDARVLGGRYQVLGLTKFPVSVEVVHVRHLNGEDRSRTLRGGADGVDVQQVALDDVDAQPHE